jgi:hypothetical protein
LEVAEMITAKAIEGSDGDQFDLFNEAEHWIGWVSRLGGDQGVLTLMSTGAPLTDRGRHELAVSATCVLREHVSAGSA